MARERRKRGGIESEDEILKSKFKPGQWVYDGQLRSQKIKAVKWNNGIFWYEFFDTGLNQPEHHLVLAPVWRAKRMECQMRDERDRLGKPPIIGGRVAKKLRLKQGKTLIGEWWWEQGCYFRWW